MIVTINYFVILHTVHEYGEVEKYIIFLINILKIL